MVMDNHLHRSSCPHLSVGSKDSDNLRVVNILAIPLLSIMIGNRRFLFYIARGKLGNPSKSSNWKWSWILSTGLNLIANVIVAAIIKGSSGYKADF